MDSSSYVTLARQSGLIREMETVANNIANLSTSGYRREGVIFSEYVKSVPGDAPSVSLATAKARSVNEMQGPMTQTNGTFDLAIEGPGYFLVETPEGQAITRAGVFTPNADGELVAPDGARLLDDGGAPVFVPADAASVAVSSDGTLSVDGQPFAQIGLWGPTEPTDLLRRAGSRFFPENGVIGVEGGRIMQGFVEGSNVDPITEIARMIQVQHAYEQGQKFLDQEDERVRGVIRTLGQ